MYNLKKMCRFAEKHDNLGMSKSEIDAMRKVLVDSLTEEDIKCMHQRLAN